ncbi:putative serine incorporator (Serinc) [Lyophyllum shimeji]|uniref:Serine incorporator (Serinc) n=1 Tax=Lyophyllum shimeji TaxID=47721 RepID=A0A9P3UPS6_LYOSH|nr:putative serine incorporator (Serinc) [Lyophyllum shimeji]
MGLLLSFPLAGALSTIATSCLAGLAFFCTSTAASMFCKSCNCNSSIATRVGFAMIFALNSILAWIMKTDLAIKQIEKWSVGYIKMDCADDKCYGVLAVHRICFALSLFHLILSLSLIGVKDTRDKRAAIQNGWWGPKVLLWLILVVVSFFIPNGFFIFWGNYIALIGATIFILLGLVLLVDFAHSWSETCLENWETSSSNFWQWVLIGSTSLMYVFTFTLTGILYAYFAGSDCTLNRFFISFNLALVILATILSVHPTVQEYNPRSGLAQAGMVAAYCTYLIVSAVSNHTHETQSCNPLRNGTGTRKAVVVLGGIFTFVAIAYSTTRAATQSRALVGHGKKGRVQLTDDELPGHSELGYVTTQPKKTESPRYQALLAAVNAGAIPASALEEEDSEDEDDVIGETRDDERSGTRYNYSWFHVIFAIGSMYVAMLLTDWNVVSKKPISGPVDPDADVYIGRSEVAMWMRVVSSWVCMLLYIWSLLAPAIMPERFGDL